jgi:hypothetical protein
VAILHLLAAHSTTSPVFSVVLLGAVLVLSLLRFRSRRGGGGVRGPFGGGGPFGRGGSSGQGRYGSGGGFGSGTTGQGGSAGESNPPSDL